MEDDYSHDLPDKLPPDELPTLPGGNQAPVSYVQHDFSPGPPTRRHARRRDPAQRWGCFKTGLAIFAMVLTAVVGSGLVIGILIYRSLSGEIQADIERLGTLEGVEDFQTTRIYDRSGQTLLYEVFAEGRRTEVDLVEIPIILRQATIATEDDSFYENAGFDPRSIMRAAYQWYSAGEIVSGGSTITQQLVKQIVFDYEERNEQTLRRKLKEAALAWVMTQEFTKDNILQLYLNEIYYGNLAYGIGGAADVYFDKQVGQLTWGEATFLAGLPQSPATYDPYANFAGAKVRQRQVLDLMVLHGYLTIERADEIFNEAPTTISDLANPDIYLEAPHFTNEARRQLELLPGFSPELVMRGGLKVYTTLDIDMQRLAERVVAEHVEAVRDEYNLTNGALVAINPNTGEVLAMVGSADYYDVEIDGAVNNILSAHQPGSTMKPLTYASAMENGWEAADVLWDVPIVYSFFDGEYEPVNYDERFHGPVRFREALARSYNIPAVMLVNEIGVADLMEISNRFGVESLGQDPAQYGLSLTLGGGEVMPLEMAVAYSVFANGGYRVEPSMILRVVDSNGGTIYEQPATFKTPVLDPRIAFVISDILSDNVARTPAMGAESPLLLPGIEAAAKTGTTNDFRDNWTIGYTPHLVAAVWAGNTNNEPMADGTSGLTGAAPIWNEFMTGAYSLPGISQLSAPGLPPLRGSFTVPPDVEEQQVCDVSSLSAPVSADEGCQVFRSEWFFAGGLNPDIKPTPLPSPTLMPDAPTPENTEPLPPMRVEVEPGLLALGVLPVEDERAQELFRETMAPILDGTPEGAPDVILPSRCLVPEFGLDLDVSEIVFELFIEAPADPFTAIWARNWAQQNNVPIDPGYQCPLDLVDELRIAAPLTDPDTGTVYVITSPKPDEEIYGIQPILGTVRFDPDLISGFRIEIGFGEQPAEWLVVGEPRFEPVEDGELEKLYVGPDTLPPGPYVLRLIVIRRDGISLPPYEVLFYTVLPPG